MIMIWCKKDKVYTIFNNFGLVIFFIIGMANQENRQRRERKAYMGWLGAKSKLDSAKEVYRSQIVD